MKKMNGVLASLGAVCLMAGAAAVADETMVESYAHPTMFSQATQTAVDANKEYVVGGKILKNTNRLGIKNKKNIAVESWAKDILNKIKFNTTDEAWNPKDPILRSELAVVLSEALGLQTESDKVYTDVCPKHWANAWIAKARNSSIMIGYPDNTFKPDQKVTKAEVFATLATLMEVPADAKATPLYNNKAVKFIPNWAVSATNEVLASQILEDVPSQNKINNDEYLTKEQVAYLVANFRSLIRKGGFASAYVSDYNPTAVKIKLTQRLSAKTSNIGDVFTAKTTENVILNNQAFAAGSTVKGEVIDVQRPGVKTTGYLRIKFTEISDGNSTLAFPKGLSEAEVAKLKNPNIVARLFGAPFSAAARVTGVAGRTAGSGVNVVGNGLEAFGDQISDAFVNTLTLHPGSGLKSLGGSIVTLGKGVFNIAELAVSGVFGVVYEVADEVVYLVVPNVSNDSALNPNEELVIVY